MILASTSNGLSSHALKKKLASATILFFFLMPFVIALDYLGIPKSRELTFLIGAMLVGVAAVLGKQVNPQAGIFCLTFVALVFIGLFSGIISQNSLGSILKDAWYILKAPTYFLVGYFLYQLFPQPKIILNMLIIAGVLLALEYFSKFLLDPSLFSVNRQYIRDNVGGGSILMPVSFAILLGVALLKISYNKYQKLLFLPFIGTLMFVMLLTQSRSFIPIFGFLLLGFTGFYRSKLAIYYVAIPTLIATLLIATPLINLFTTPQERANIYQKTPSFLQEAFVFPHQGLKAINQNWRGFEAYRAFKEVEDASFLHQATGIGLGGAVELGMQMTLGTGAKEQMFERITVFHNGYAFAVVKSGILGLIIYCGLMVYVFRLGSAHPRFGDIDNQQKFWKGLLAGLALSQMYTSMTVNGMFNSDGGGAALLMIMGTCVAIITGRQQLHEAYAQNN